LHNTRARQIYIRAFVVWSVGFTIFDLTTGHFFWMAFQITMLFVNLWVWKQVLRPSPQPTPALPWRYQQADDLKVPVVDVVRAARYEVIAGLMPAIEQRQSVNESNWRLSHDPDCTRVQTRAGWMDREVVRRWSPERQWALIIPRDEAARTLTVSSIPAVTASPAMNFPPEEVAAAAQRLYQRGWRNCYECGIWRDPKQSHQCKTRRELLNPHKRSNCTTCRNDINRY
jgi:hypothetical protein